MGKSSLRWYEMMEGRRDGRRDGGTNDEGRRRRVDSHRHLPAPSLARFLHNQMHTPFPSRLSCPSPFHTPLGMGDGTFRLCRLLAIAQKMAGAGGRPARLLSRKVPRCPHTAHFPHSLSMSPFVRTKTNMSASYQNIPKHRQPSVGSNRDESANEPKG